MVYLQYCWSLNCILTSVLTVEMQPFGHANAPFLFVPVLTDAYVEKIVKRERGELELENFNAQEY